MSVRLWPNDYEQKDHISMAEKKLLRNAARNFKNGHLAVGIDPLGLSNDKVRIGMYISPEEGLITFSIYQGKIAADDTMGYILYVEMTENRIYERLCDSKALIVRNENRKALRFPYKHIIMFPDEKVGTISIPKDQIERLVNYCTFEFFRPINSNGKEKTVAQLGIFSGIRKEYDNDFDTISDLECRAIFERLAPEYTVVMTEVEKVEVTEKKNLITSGDLFITGKEQEFRTFYLDEYQVSQVNDMGTGHRVILANPGAGKSVLLLSKSFKYASMLKDSKVLLTCYNNNLADAYSFKRACADFGDKDNLLIMTFHKLVKMIYNECLYMHLESNIATENEIESLIQMIRGGKVDLRFKAIFIDEVQNFDPLYLELCYSLLEKDNNNIFLMAGDLNQSVRAQSRKGDVPWKRINGVKLDFTGRVKYIEKNYRNSRDIGEYLYEMLKTMNNRMSVMGLINSMEYEYNSFTLGSNKTTALRIMTGINRQDIKNEVIKAIKEIVGQYDVSYSDIAILFPVRKKEFLRYYFLYWIETALKTEDIPYSMIITGENRKQEKIKYSNTKGVIISTIESSLGLDFKAVVLAGLFPYNYVFPQENRSIEIKSWSIIKTMSDDEQSLVQSQMRSIYTACSRARDILYVLSDLKPGTPMEEIIDSGNEKYHIHEVDERKKASVMEGSKKIITKKRATKAKKKNQVLKVRNRVTITAEIIETNEKTTFIVDLKKYPKQQSIIGKGIGETFSFSSKKNTYKIIAIDDKQ